ncbi:MAG TPA: SDR family oxidoreductase [Burkholderiales bacterium]|nr:SDR family oxidoreductase [Burkholderiales bacterium]
MRVLVLGAGGFIGRHAAAALRAAGHEVMAGAVDFTRAPRAADWTDALRGAHAVVNAVGIFRERGANRFERVHESAPCALFDACVACGVRRVVQVSALGADEGARSRFHLSKRRADDYLASLELDWSIVQPSLVFGEGGASARLFAMLAALPFTPVPGAGRQQVQPIHVDDLAQAIVRLVAEPARARIAAVGPRALALREWLALLRLQLGLGRARFISVPLPLVPLDGETLAMLERGNTAPADCVARLLGRAPRDPAQFIDAEAAGALATRARLDWLLPLLAGSVAFVWVMSGVVSLGLYPVQESLAMLARVGLASPWVLYGAAAFDIAMGIAIFALARRRWLWRLQMAAIVAYSAIIAVWLPEAWLHPFGPMLKNVPLLAAILLLHELEQRPR